MIPLRDNIPSRTVPVVNYLLIAACAFGFLLQLGDNADGRDEMTEGYGMVPARVLNPDQPIDVVQYRKVNGPFGPEILKESRPLAPCPIPPWMTIFTCMFLHGGWMHFLGNMWFLHIFGDNVEDRFGHGGYLLLYVACGVAASLMHLVTNLNSTMPTIGASGAIAGVMGAYMVCYPRAMILTLIPFIIIQVVVLPAPIFLGIWFLMNLFQGAFSFVETATGVAWWAHIGGFVAGFLVAKAMGQMHQLRPRVEAIRPNTERVRVYPYRFRERP